MRNDLEPNSHGILIIDLKRRRELKIIHVYRILKTQLVKLKTLLSQKELECIDNNLTEMCIVGGDFYLNAREQFNA
jgi:hypothetical protein